VEGLVLSLRIQVNKMIMAREESISGFWVESEVYSGSLGSSVEGLKEHEIGKR
jgi:hypothetical protein